MNHPPTVSLITPSYNQAKFLGETLASVRQQRSELHEYFVMDGGSTDGSLNLIKENQDIIDYYEAGPDGGQSSALSKGFAKASGDILGWINSDDVLLAGAIDRVQRAFAADPTLDVVSGYQVLIDEHSRIVRTQRIPRQTAWAARRGVLHVSQPSCFFRRIAYENVGGLNTELACVMDTDLWLRLLQASSRWGHVPQFLSAFRIHPDSKGQSWLARYEAEHVFLEQKYPHMRRKSLSGKAARTVFRVKELVRGRYLREVAETWRVRGQHISRL